MITQKKICQYCDKSILGRADKKFCDDYCRNSFNNNLKSTSGNYIRNIQNSLKRNRNILENILNDGVETVKIPKEKLYGQGFQFKYHTHTYINKKGSIYYYCFDYGFLELENQWLLVVRQRED